MAIEKIVGKGKESKKKGRRSQKKVSPVQKLYATCKEVFSKCGPGIIPSPTDVERLKFVLDTMTESDVGLGPNMPFFRAKETEQVPKITYLHLHGCDKFSIGIFCLPPSGVIPLHNHPGMTVFSKLLFGRMHIKSFDWVDDGSHDTSPNGNPLNTHPAGEHLENVKVNSSFTDNAIQPANIAAHPAGVRLAKVKVNSHFTAPNTSILYPADGGNLHCFTALTPCAVLDVLGPPYSDRHGRHCTYYLDFPFSNFSVDGISVHEEEKEGYAWLQEREEPEDFAVVGLKYSEQLIMEK